jgi:hypothetical protein
MEGPADIFLERDRELSMYVTTYMVHVLFLLLIMDRYRA